MNKKTKTKKVKQTEVIKYLIKKGFNCTTISEDSLIAWKPFINSKGESPLVSTNTNIQGKVFSNNFVPFFVAFVKSLDKKITTKDKKEAEKILEENRCNVFLFARKEKDELRFNEMSNIMNVNSSVPSYLG